LEKLKPEYNILLQAGSNLGIPAAPALETRKKMSISKKGKPSNKLGTVLTSEVRAFFKEKSGMSINITMLNSNN
jgi:hypothetical protein